MTKELPPLPNFTPEQKAWLRLGTLECGYEDTKNPLFAWAAWQLCRENNIQIPDDILEYFDRCATSLLALTEQDAQKDANAVTAALELNCAKGKRSSFTYYENFFREDLQAALVLNEIENLQKTKGVNHITLAINNICDASGKYEPSTLYRAYKKKHKEMLEIAEKIIEIQSSGSD